MPPPRKHHSHLRTTWVCGALALHMVGEPDQNVRKTVSLPSGAWSCIEDFQFENRLKRESEAIRGLIELGLGAAKTKTETVR